MKADELRAAATAELLALFVLGATGATFRRECVTALGAKKAAGAIFDPA